MISFENLIYTKEDALRVIQLNRPKSLNALCAELTREMSDVLTELESDGDARVLIITGGDRAFAAGADIGEMLGKNPFDAHKHCLLAHCINDRIEQLTIPTIASIEGLALGGGLELALSCDFRVAGRSSKVSFPEVSLGIIPGAGGTQRLVKLIGVSKAKEVILFAKILPAEQAYALGLIDVLVGDGESMNEARKMALKLQKMPALALEAAKRVINFGVNNNMESGKQMESLFFSMLFASEDQTEGMKAFMEKRKPNYCNK